MTRICRFRSGACAAGFIILALVLGTAQAQIPVWIAQYNGPGGQPQDDANAIALTPDSCVVITGFSQGTDLSRDFATIKYNRHTGDTLWIRRWFQTAGSNDEGWAIACDASGNVFVGGKTRFGATDSDFVTLKYLSDGTLSWMKRYHFAGSDAVSAILPDGRGGVFVTGPSNATAGAANPDFFVIHYAPDSTVLWTSRLNPFNGRDIPSAMTMDNSGNLYVVGSSYGGSTPDMDYYVVKYDTSDGDTVWTQRYDGTSTAWPKFDYGYGITTDDSGYVYVTGKASEVGTWFDATTIKFAADGSRVWVFRFDGGELGADGASHVLVDKDYNVYCGGYVDNFTSGYDMLTFRINHADTLDWARTFDNLTDDDSVTAMVLDNTGNVYVTGSTCEASSSTPNWETIKYGPNGARVWFVEYGASEEDDEPRGMVIDEVGDLYVTGYGYPVSHDNYVTVKYTESDAGVARVVFPADSFRIDATVVPKAWVKSYSAVTQRSFTARMEIGGFYFDAQVVDSVLPYDSVLVEFASWPVRDPGTYSVRSYTMLSTDKDLHNDTAYSTVSGVPVWEALAPMPVGAKNKGVKDGGTLGFVPDTLVLAFKGNNRVEFYAFNTMRQAWVTKESIPPVGRSGSRKRIKAGARLAGNGLDGAYAFKGNNTPEFWFYSVPGDTWKQLDDLPTGASGRRVKGGSGLAYVSSWNVVYGLKGANTQEFYGFDVENDTWLPKSSVPLGPANKKVKDGSSIAYDGEGTIYLIKGACYELWSYNLAQDTWHQEKLLRNSGIQPKKRKFKKGAALAFDTEFKKLYATKGGKSTEFWYFDVVRDSWMETVDDFPVQTPNKFPYAGSDMCYGNGKIYALTGNRTLDFQRYNANFPLNPDGMDGQQALVQVSLPGLVLGASPNPFRSRTFMRYALPQAGHVRLVLYDVTGRQARVLRDEPQMPGEYVYSLRSDGLAAGVYLAKLWVSTGSATLEATRKVLISR